MPGPLRQFTVEDEPVILQTTLRLKISPGVLASSSSSSGTETGISLSGVGEARAPRGRRRRVVAAARENFILMNGLG